VLSRYTATARKLFGLILCASALARAQASPSLEAGVRVQLVFTPGRCEVSIRGCPPRNVIFGNILRSSPDSIVVQLNSQAAVAFRRDAEYGLFASTGHSRLRPALRRGATIGLIAALMANRSGLQRNQGIGWTVGLTGIGLVAGALQPEEGWQRIAR
jgi:hypothetical protein